MGGFSSVEFERCIQDEARRFTVRGESNSHSTPSPGLGRAFMSVDFLRKRRCSGQCLDAIKPKIVGRGNIRELRQAIRRGDGGPVGAPRVVGQVLAAPNLKTS